jgi:ferritin-like protein
MANEGYHEPVSELTDEARDMHRAIVSLMEELEAVDWYNQRMDACKDDELRAILKHNRDEEKEHAAMVLEWIRRHDATSTRNCATRYSLTRSSITTDRWRHRQPASDAAQASQRGTAQMEKTLDVIIIGAGSAGLAALRKCASAPRTSC